MKEEKYGKPMTTKDKSGNGFSDNLRYMLLIGAILLIVAAVLLIVHLVSPKTMEIERRNRKKAAATRKQCAG